MMIGFLRGRIEHITLENIYLDVCGVGYEICISNPEKYKLYEEVMVHTYMAIRENDITLYGFFTKEEKDLFLKLISVKGIGPKSAISMLSKADYNNIIEAIKVKDKKYILGVQFHPEIMYYYDDNAKIIFEDFFSHLTKK